MISGAHSIIFSTNPDADRAFINDTFDFPSVDVGGGWLIFGLPPSELAVHPSENNDVHEFYLMCDDINEMIAHLRDKGISCSEAQELSWGSRINVSLPGGGKLGIYEPKHERPAQTARPI